METIEIRLHKKINKVILVIFSLCAMGMVIKFFVVDIHGSMFDIIIQIGLTLLFLLIVYSLAIKLKNKTAIITFRDDSIILHENLKPTYIARQDITALEVEEEEDNNGFFFIVSTIKREHKVNINWLDKRPEEIKSIAQKYLQADLDK